MTVNVGVLGIDVSRFNPDTNWPMVKAAGKAFAFIKCTEGLSVRNPYFKIDWAASKAAGVIRGAYHFFHPKDDPVEQANWFLSHLGDLTVGDLPAVLDMETPELAPEKEVESALIWLDIVEKATGKKPIIYADKDYIKLLKNPPQFAQYPLWLAGYTLAPDVPLPWKGYTFWQYSGSGKVPGVAGFCDLSKCGGDLAWLTEFSNQTK